MKSELEKLKQIVREIEAIELVIIEIARKIPDDDINLHRLWDAATILADVAHERMEMYKLC